MLHTNCLTAGLLLISLSVVGCRRSATDEAAALVSVEAAKPEVGEISEHVMADATLSPLAQAAISPKITAPVRKFYVQRGSKVKEGQLLAVLENRDLTAQALDNEGQYSAAQAGYEIQTKAQVPEDYSKAQLDVAQTQAQLHLQQQIVTARKKLLDEGAIAGRDYDTAVAALAQSRSAYDVALNHLNSLQRVSRTATLQQAEGQLSSARGKYLAAEAQVAYSEIHSPISGVVTDRPLFPGETAAAGSTLITVMDTSALLAKVHLSQIVAQRLSLGDDAQITMQGIDEPIPAKVSLISPALDPGSTTVEVWLRVSNAVGKYKPGTPVRTSISGRTIPKAVKIPQSAILTANDGSKSVMVIGNDSAAHKVAVQLGITDGQSVQVTSGLSGSENVIVSGAYGLDEGTKVKVGKPDNGDEAGGEK